MWQCSAVSGKPLTHVDAKPKFIYRTFPFFFLLDSLQRECIKRVRQLGVLKTDTHSQRWKRRLQEYRLAWGVESYVTITG